MPLTFVEAVACLIGMMAEYKPPAHEQDDIHTLYQDLDVFKLQSNPEMCDAFRELGSEFVQAMVLFHVVEYAPSDDLPPAAFEVGHILITASNLLTESFIDISAYPGSSFLGISPRGHCERFLVHGTGISQLRGCDFDAGTSIAESTTDQV